jgi:hypothetical protein
VSVAAVESVCQKGLHPIHPWVGGGTYFVYFVLRNVLIRPLKIDGRTIRARVAVSLAVRAYIAQRILPKIP